MGNDELGRRFDCMCADVADLEGVANALDWAEYRVGVCRTIVNATYETLNDSTVRHGTGLCYSNPRATTAG